MVDPILSLAFSVHANKGVYALLLGSGLSRAAGIPTGWEIVLDLVRKLARIRGEDCEPDPAAWYAATFGDQPDYANLLEALAKAPAERSQLLRPYFEPTPEDRQQGLKVPTPAHKAIAGLVAAGYVRVIVTTNFDRLLEESLAEVGAVPAVISTPDLVEGALPLAHSACTLIKVHGDYLDTRIKNSPAELAQYDPRLDRLLDHVFDEYGLIVCGWSAEWDSALRAALERCKSRRFTTYWALRGDQPSEPARRLVGLRRAEIIHVKDASSFFLQLSEKVQALEDMSRPHPLSAKVAVATLKRYISDDRHMIDLHDLVVHETERVYEQLQEEFPAQGVPFTQEELIRRVNRYEATVEVLLAMTITGCYWGREQHEEIWVKSLSRIAGLDLRNGLVVWLNLKKYPALLLLYAGGISSLAGRRPRTLAALLAKAVLREGDEVPAARGLYPGAVMEQPVGWQLPEMDRHYTPVSDHLYNVLRQPCKGFLLDDTDYQRNFDRFEYLLGLVHADLREKRKEHPWGPIGCFGWRRDRRAIAELETEMTTMGDGWPLLKAGLFDGSHEKLQSVKKAFDQELAHLNWY